MITLSEYLETFEFSYKINNDNTISLVDLCEANLADIENEKFEITKDLPIELSNRLEVYEDDYIFEDIISVLRDDYGYSGETYPYDEFILPEMKKHTNMFSKRYISFVEDVINYNIDISELYKIQT